MENSTILPVLVEAVVAAAAEFGEAVFEGVGEVDGFGCGCGFGGFLCGDFFWLGGFCFAASVEAVCMGSSLTSARTMGKRA